MKVASCNPVRGHRRVNASCCGAESRRNFRVMSPAAVLWHARRVGAQWQVASGVTNAETGQSLKDEIEELVHNAVAGS
jgi:hypothetical protein